MSTTNHQLTFSNWHGDTGQYRLDVRIPLASSVREILFSCDDLFLYQSYAITCIELLALIGYYGIVPEMGKRMGKDWGFGAVVPQTG